MQKSIDSDILIRKGKLGDEQGIFELQKIGFKTKNWVYTGANKTTKARLEKMRQQFLKKPCETYSFVAIDKITGKIIGISHCSFSKKGRLRHRVGFGWSMHPDYQGKGIATRMLNYGLDYVKKKGFKRAEAEMAIENKASWKLALKCGFKIEGTKKKALLTDDGRYVDTYIVGKIL